MTTPAQALDRSNMHTLAPDGGCIVTLEDLDEIERKIRYDGNAMRHLFAEVYGYTLAKSPFSVDQLAGRAGRNYGVSRCTEFLDHPTWYRWPVRPYRPAAIVVQLYGVEGRLERILEWAEDHGLNATCLRDFPSWHSPSNSSLIVYTREGDFLRRTASGTNQHPQGRKAMAWELVRRYRELLRYQLSAN